MKPFWAIFKLNFFRTINTWMIKFLFAICIIGIALGCMLLNRSQTIEKTKIYVQGETEIFTEDFYHQLEANGYIVTNDSNTSWDILVEIQDIGKTETIVFHYAEKNMQDLLLKQLFQNWYNQTLVEKYNVEVLEIKEMYVETNSDDFFNVFMVTTIIIYLFIIVCGGAITSSVAMEKISKASELLTYRISTLTIIYAKILALFLTIAVIVLVAIIEIILINKSGFMPIQVENILHFFKIDLKTVLFLVIDTSLGIYLYTLIYTMVGLTIEEAEQLQYAQLPATIVLFIAYGVGFFSCFMPKSLFVKIAFFIPIFTPFVAPATILGRNISGFLICCSVAVNLVFIIFCNFIISEFFVPNKKIKKGRYLV